MHAHRLLTSEVARMCGVSAQTVRIWETSGRLHADKTASGVRLFDPEEVATFAASRRRRAADVSSAPTSMPVPELAVAR